MRPHRLLAAATATTVLRAGTLSAQPTPGGAAPPPPAPVRLVVDSLHGVALPDPYRYFEDPRDSTGRAWAAAQGAHARRVFDALPGRAALADRLTTLDTLVPSVGRPTEAGGRLFYTLQRPADPVPVLRVREGLAGADRVLADPAAHRPPGYTGPVTLGGWSVSRDGRRVAYSVTAGGSEFHTVYVRDVATGRLLADSVGGHDVWDSELSPDGRVLFYSHGPAGPAEALTAARFKHVTTYRHVIGTPLTDDRPLLGRGGSARVPVDSTLFPGITIGPRAGLGVATVNNGVSRISTYYAAPLGAAVAGQADVPWRRVAAPDDSVQAVEVVGDTLFLLSLKGAPNGRVLRLVWPPAGPDAPFDLARAEVVLEGGPGVLQRVDAGRDALYVTAARAVGTQLLRVPYGARRLTLAAVDTLAPPVAGARISVAPREAAPGAFVLAQSWALPARWFVYDPATRQYGPTPFPSPAAAAELADVVVVDTAVTTADGAQVPLTLVHRRGVARDGRAAAFLYGYGAYGIRDDASWFPPAVAWVERGGVFAVCHVRGGGARGEAWHVAGMRERKANTWRDFNACAEWLTRAGYTRPARLGALGASAGGILVGRAIEERPDLYGAAVAGVPVADLVRFELATPGGAANTHEFGSVRTPAGLAAAVAMSPYRQAADGTRYPALLVFTGANDRRVPWWVAAKYAARMQAATGSGRPVLLRYETDEGHGGGTTRAQRVGEFADILGFLYWQLGEPGYQPPAARGAAAGR